MPPPKKPVWRNHYTPRFYLRQWAVEQNELIWCYRREPSGTVSEKRCSTEATGFKKDLYTERTVVEGMQPTEPDAVEIKLFGSIDNDAANVLPKMIQDPATLLPEEKVAWARFVHSLLERGPRTLAPVIEAARARVLQMYEEMRATHPAPASRASLEKVLGTFDEDGFAQNAALGRMVTNVRNDDLVEGLANCGWRVLQIGQRVPIDLLTSDTPVVVNGGVDREEIGLLSMALTPRHLFILATPAWEPLLDADTLRNLLLTHNGLVIRHAQYAYSHCRLVDGPVMRTRLLVDHHLGRPKSEVPKSDEP